MSGRRDDFLRGRREFWQGIVDDLAGPERRSRTTWSNPKDIKRVLGRVMGPNNNHTHLPDGGGFDAHSIEDAPEKGCLKLRMQLGAVAVFKPRILTMEYFENFPIDSFFLLEIERLDPLGVVPASSDEREHLTCMGDGTYRPRRFLKLMLDREEEDGTPVPEGIEAVLRYTTGNFLIVSKGSYWNGRPETYDGRHSQMTPDDIRSLIED